MTRQKKSRTGGSNGLRHTPAAEARQNREHKVERKKKGAGLKSGSRNSQVEPKRQGAAVSADKADPRLGSKQPVALVPVTEQTITATTSSQLQPKAKLQKAQPQALTSEQELAAIESDSYLQQLLERVERDEILSGKDAKYFNAKTARLEQLLQQLGLDDSETEEHDPLASFEKTDWRKTILGDE